MRECRNRSVRLEVIPRCEVLIGMELVRAAVKLIRAGFDLHVDGCAACHSLFGVERVSHDIDGLDGVSRWYVGHIGRQPWIGILSTVKTGVDRLIGLTIDV